MSVRHPAPDDRDVFIAAAQRSRALHEPWTTAPDTDEAFAAYLDDPRGTASPACWSRGTTPRNSSASTTSPRSCGAHSRTPTSATTRSCPTRAAGRCGARCRSCSSTPSTSWACTGCRRTSSRTTRPRARCCVATGWREEGFAPRYLRSTARGATTIMYAITVEETPGGRPPADASREVGRPDS